MKKIILIVAVVLLVVGIFTSMTFAANTNQQVYDLAIRVSANSDDAEESASGVISRGSGDLELVQEDTIQTVGMRFNDVSIPQGKTIVGARIQFKVDETDTTNPCNLILRGEKVSNAVTFSSTAYDITDRPTTSASVMWSPPEWDTVGEIGEDQKTPSLIPIIQEIVNQPSWSSGNSLVIIITGEGERVAESYNGDAAGAPLLLLAYADVPAPTSTSNPWVTATYQVSTPTPTQTQPAPTNTPNPTSTTPAPTPTPLSQALPPELSDMSGNGGNWMQWSRYYYEAYEAAAFEDTFSRADSNFLREGWSELELGQNRLLIESSAMKFQSTGHNFRPVAVNAFGDASLPNTNVNMYLRDLVKLEFDFDMCRINLDPGARFYIQLGQGNLMDYSGNDISTGIAAQIVYTDYSDYVPPHPLSAETWESPDYSGGTSAVWSGSTPVNGCTLGAQDSTLRVAIEVALPYKKFRVTAANTGISSGGNVFYTPRFGWWAGENYFTEYVDENVEYVNQIRFFTRNMDTDNVINPYIDNVEVRIGDAWSGDYTWDTRVKAPLINPLTKELSSCNENSLPGSCEYNFGDQTIDFDHRGMGVAGESLEALWCPDTNPYWEGFTIDWHQSCDPRHPYPEPCHNFPHGKRDSTTCDGTFFSEGLFNIPYPNSYGTRTTREIGSANIWQFDLYFIPLGPRGPGDRPGEGPWDPMPYYVP